MLEQRLRLRLRFFSVAVAAVAPEEVVEPRGIRGVLTLAPVQRRPDGLERGDVAGERARQPRGDGRASSGSPPSTATSSSVTVASPRKANELVAPDQNAASWSTNPPSRRTRHAAAVASTASRIPTSATAARAAAGAFHPPPPHRRRARPPVELDAVAVAKNRARAGAQPGEQRRWRPRGEEEARRSGDGGGPGAGDDCGGGFLDQRRFLVGVGGHCGGRRRWVLVCLGF